MVMPGDTVSLTIDVSSRYGGGGGGVMVSFRANRVSILQVTTAPKRGGGRFRPRVPETSVSCPATGLYQKEN